MANPPRLGRGRSQFESEHLDQFLKIVLDFLVGRIYNERMSQIQRLRDLTDEDMLEICDTFTSAQDYLRSIGVSSKGQYGSILNNKRKELGFEWQLPPNRIKSVACPVCNEQFKPTKGQVTCSHSCANTHFRSGADNPNYRENRKDYRTTCFAIHEKKCIVCGEDKIVEVHHADEDHTNNDPANLVPLCPTHHQYFHSKYRYLVEPIIKEFMFSGHRPL